MKTNYSSFAMLAGLALLMVGANSQAAPPPDITISVGIVTVDDQTKLDLRDGTNKDANYFVARPGQRVIWEAGTDVATFNLEFFRISQGKGGAGVLDSNWPFERDSANDDGAGNVDYKYHNTVGATKFNPLIVANGKGVYKYTIKIPLSSGDTIEFDPIIIIEPGNQALSN